MITITNTPESQAWLENLAIPARNALLDEWAEDQQAEQAALAELAAERANEAWWEHRGGPGYAGSVEDSRDRWLDSLAAV